MEAKNFPGVNILYGKDQPEYKELPAYLDPGATGTVVTSWELSNEELERLNETKTIWLGVQTFHKPLQPLLLSTEQSELMNEPQKDCKKQQ